MVIGCYHKEGTKDLSTYEGFYVAYPPSEGQRLFNTGNPIADFRSAVKLAQAQGVDDIMLSSSVDNLVHDIPEYEWYLDDEIGKAIRMKSSKRGHGLRDLYAKPICFEPDIDITGIRFVSDDPDRDKDLGMNFARLPTNQIKFELEQRGYEFRVNSVTYQYTAYQHPFYKVVALIFWREEPTS